MTCFPVYDWGVCPLFCAFWRQFLTSLWRSPSIVPPGKSLFFEPFKFCWNLNPYLNGDPMSSEMCGHGGSHPYLVNEFVDAVARDRQPAINAWVAVRYLAPGIMAHKSAMRDGETLKVPDWGDPPA